MKLIDVDNSAVNDIIRSSGKGNSITNLNIIMKITEKLISTMVKSFLPN